MTYETQIQFESLKLKLAELSVILVFSLQTLFVSSLLLLTSSLTEVSFSDSVLNLEVERSYTEKNGNLKMVTV